MSSDNGMDWAGAKGQGSQAAVMDDAPPPQAIQVIDRAEVDIQISTARANPMHTTTDQIAAFHDKARALIAQCDDPSECYYTLYRKERDEKTGRMVDKPISGESIRLAEIIALSWGNLRISAEYAGHDGEFVRSRGRAWDLETNVAVSRDGIRQIKGRSGTYGTNMIMVTANAAMAIAQRNVTIGIIPRAYAHELCAFARQQMEVRIKDLPGRRQKMFEWFAETHKVTEEQ